MKTINEYKTEIVNIMARGGQYWHNLVGLKLGSVSQLHGKEAANKLIVELKLDKKGWSVVKLLLVFVCVGFLGACEKKKNHIPGAMPGVQAQALPTPVYPTVCQSNGDCPRVPVRILSDSQAFTFNTAIADDEIWILYVCPRGGAVADIPPTEPRSCKEERNNSGPMMQITATGAVVTGGKSAEYWDFQAWRQKVEE